MRTSRRLAIGALGLSAWVSNAYAIIVVPPSTVNVTVTGDVASSTLTANAVVGLLPAVQSQGLTNDIGFAVTGPFTFDTSNTANPSITYTVTEQINLTPGSYEVSSYLLADSITDTPVSGGPQSSATGYVQAFEMTTSLYSDAGLTSLVAQSNGGSPNLPSTGFGPGGTSPFCPLSNCPGLSSGNAPGVGDFTVATAGQYYLSQTFTSSLNGAGIGDVVTMDLPGSSGVGTPAPEPGFWGVLGAGVAALVFARRRRQMKAIPPAV